MKCDQILLKNTTNINSVFFLDHDNFLTISVCFAWYQSDLDLYCLLKQNMKLCKPCLCQAEFEDNIVYFAIYSLHFNSFYLKLLLK